MTRILRSCQPSVNPPNNLQLVGPDTLEIREMYSGPFELVGPDTFQTQFRSGNMYPAPLLQENPAELLSTVRLK